MTAPHVIGLWVLILALSGCAPRKEVMRHPAPPGMIFVKGGEFEMGTDAGNPDEAPAHRVRISDFYLDQHEVTNSQFAAFVSSTGYVTTAEKRPDAKDFPGVSPDKLVPGAAVFAEGKGWSFVPGANWRHPRGPGSNIEKLGNHPVAQVSWFDAVAYAKWAGKRLPTEAEFEYVAKAGRANPAAIWEEQPGQDSKPLANIWQGDFPLKNDNLDGFKETSPVASFPPGRWGFSDLAGNVWEWCSDLYHAGAYKMSDAVNPQGPKSSLDPDEPNSVKRVMRGGSFLCADCYCRGYRPTARMKSSPDTGLFHVGFRCAQSIKQTTASAAQVR